MNASISEFTTSGLVASIQRGQAGSGSRLRDFCAILVIAEEMACGSVKIEPRPVDQFLAEIAKVFNGGTVGIFRVFSMPNRRQKTAWFTYCGRFSGSSTSLCLQHNCVDTKARSMLTGLFLVTEQIKHLRNWPQRLQILEEQRADKNGPLAFPG